ncbi:hypothetical protein ACSBR1_011948 [Camellia fascicularis]
MTLGASSDPIGLVLTSSNLSGRWSCRSDGPRWPRVLTADQHRQVEEILPLSGSLGRKPERVT